MSTTLSRSTECNTSGQTSKSSRRSLLLYAVGVAEETTEQNVSKSSGWSKKPVLYSSSCGSRGRSGTGATTLDKRKGKSQWAGQQRQLSLQVLRYLDVVGVGEQLVEQLVALHIQAA